MEKRQYAGRLWPASLICILRDTSDDALAKWTQCYHAEELESRIVLSKCLHNDSIRLSRKSFQCQRRSKCIPIRKGSLEHMAVSGRVSREQHNLCEIGLDDSTRIRKEYHFLASLADTSTLRIRVLRHRVCRWSPNAGVAEFIEHRYS
jgi:hypothetical protein